MGVRLSDPNDLPDLNADEAMNRLDEGLETCRSVIADYRAALIASGGAPDEVAGHETATSAINRDGNIPLRKPTQRAANEDEWNGQKSRLRQRC